MKNLIYNDVARCVGRFGLGPDDPICPHRESCTRYLQITLDRDRFPDGIPLGISYATGLCADGDDYMIRAVDDGNEVLHRRSDGAVALAKMPLDTIREP